MDDKIRVTSFGHESYLINLSSKDYNHFQTNLRPSLDLVVSNLNKSKTRVDFFQNHFESFLNNINNYSPEFLEKINQQLKTLTPNQTELFLEAIRYNDLKSKRFNPLFDILRIKKGIITKKVIKTSMFSVCSETYLGFIRAIESKTVKLITLEVEGKKKVMLVKSIVGNKRKRVGTNTLALDPSNFNVYSFDNLNYKNPKAISKGNQPTMVDGFINYNFAKELLKSKSSGDFTKYNLNKIISQVKTIKKLLKEYSKENLEKRNESFKKAAKKMLSDKKTRDVIKKRFRK